MSGAKPGTVVAAGVVLITTAALCGLITLWAIAAIVWIGDVFGGIVGESGASEFDAQYWGTMSSWMVLQFVTLGVCALAVLYGIALLRSRTRSTQIIATVLAVLLILSWLPGLVAVIAVPVLLWAPEASRAWFSQPGGAFRT